MAKRPKNCTYCSEALNREERRSPRKDEAGDVMCDQCFSRHYESDCSRCCELFETTELDTRPGNLIGVWVSVPACGQDDLASGYYRVLSWPIFADGMIDGYFFGRALQFACHLDAKGLRRAKDEQFMSGPMCPQCRSDVERQIPRDDGVRVGGSASG